MLSPKKTKWRKQMKQVRHLQGTETRGAKVSYGDWGLRAVEAGWVTNRQIEAGRVAISRVLKKGGKVWIRIFPDKPLTKKPAETRMGSGKGSPEQWVAEVRAGRLMYEIGGTDEASAKKALLRCAAKLPLQSKIVGRSNFLLSA